MRRNSFIIIALLLMGMTACQPNQDKRMLEKYTHPFPRLGMWWLNPYETDVEDMARYDLLLDSFDDEYLQERLQDIKKINPKQLNVKPLSPTERQLFAYDWEEAVYYPNPEVTRLPSFFFLLQTGTNLVENLDAKEKMVFVESMYDKKGQPLFHIDGEVAIGESESAKIVEIFWEEKALLVERGYIREATAHFSGERIASHIRFWPGSWVMNVTAACPRIQVFGVDHQVNYIEYYYALICGQTTGIYQKDEDNYDRITNLDLYEGIVIDRFEDKESWLRWVNEPDEIELDLYHNNTFVDAAVFDASWEEGTTQLYTLIAYDYPDVTIIRNNPLTLRYEPFQGQVYESFGWSNPSTEWWENLVVHHDEEDYYSGFAYLEWWKENSLKHEPLVLFEVYEEEGGPKPNDELDYESPYDVEGFVPNYQKMRFSLTSSLLGNGYYSYEINTEGHGSLGLMWFDEYDNVGVEKGYLGYPEEEAIKLESGAYQRTFEHGIVFVNPTNQSIHISLDQAYRKIKGKQQPTVNTGEVVEELSIPAYDGIILLENDF